MGRILRTGVKSALARWVIVKRRGHWAAPAPTPQDEATHAWDGQPLFAEDYTFVGVQAGLGVVMRLEWRPGRESQRVWMVILRPDGVWAPPGGQRVLRTGSGDRWSAGGLRLDCQTPLREWTLRFGGPLVAQGHARDAPPLRVVAHDGGAVRGSVDLTFVTTAAPHVPGIDDDPELLARCLGEATWDAQLLRAARKASPRGYVQPGSLYGTVAVGDVLVPVQAAALRQHHWGPRDFGAYARAYQCFWASQDERRGWLHHTTLPLVALDGGFVEHRGRRAPVRSLSASLETRPQRAPTRVSLDYGDVDGTRRLHAEVVAELALPVDGGVVTLGLLQLTGRSPGWGLWAQLRPQAPSP
ncbi:MAG: hypothetical protein KDK70_29505 [Myxococcales bacterium]|nr:hypothetical protein [Myxococcales bacterium]